MAEIGVFQLREAARDCAEGDPDMTCRKLEVDPAAVKEAMEGMGIGMSPQDRGTLAIALLAGIKAGREAERV
jgi:hypothetical protein